MRPPQPWYDGSAPSTEPGKALQTSEWPVAFADRPKDADLDVTEPRITANYSNFREHGTAPDSPATFFCGPADAIKNADPKRYHFDLADQSIYAQLFPRSDLLWAHAGYTLRQCQQSFGRTPHALHAAGLERVWVIDIVDTFARTRWAGFRLKSCCNMRALKWSGLAVCEQSRYNLK